MQARIVSIVGGVITLVIGLVLSGVITETASKVGANSMLTSFSGAKAINDLVPLIYFTVIVMVAVGMIGVGLGGFMGRGPMR